MSKTEHTPTPWRVEIPGDRIVADDHKGTMPIADIRGWGHLTGKGLGALGLSNVEGIAIQEANAAFIVKAVNNHEALVARVKYLEATEANKILQLKMALQTIAGMDPKGIRADDLGRSAEIARAALAAFRIDTDSDFATPIGQDEAALKRLPVPIESLGNYPDLVTYDENGREIGRVSTVPGASQDTSTERGAA